MSKGTVKWFNTKKGYGFIQPESGEKISLSILPNWKKQAFAVCSTDRPLIMIFMLTATGNRPPATLEFYSPDYRSVVRERSSEMRAVSCIKKTPAHEREFNEEREAATAP